MLFGASKNATIYLIRDFRFYMSNFGLEDGTHAHFHRNETRHYGV